MVSQRQRGIGGRLRRGWRAFALAVRRVAMLEDQPERIARGCAAGVATAFLPIFGQTLAGMLVAWCIRGSLLAVVPWSWLTNPLTTLPCWYGCYLLGSAIIPGDRPLTWEGLQLLITQLEGMAWLDRLHHGASVLGGVFLPMLLGSVVVGVVAAVPTWWLVRRAVQAVQARRAARCAHWKSRLVPKAPGATT